MKEGTATIIPNLTEKYLNSIVKLDSRLFDYFQNSIQVDNSLTRQLVSFQANKKQPTYRWYKYKEAFSSSLVKHLLQKFDLPQGIVFDPFTGVGTTLFASSEIGYDSEGIELLPVGIQVIHNTLNAKRRLKESDLSRILEWKEDHPWKFSNHKETINYLNITKSAYSKETEESIGKYLFEINKENPVVRGILFFVLLCILESISFTRKDGQYLRWDYRSGRRKGQNTFDKGLILNFEEKGETFHRFVV